MLNSAKLSATPWAAAAMLVLELGFASASGAAELRPAQMLFLPWEIPTRAWGEDGIQDVLGLDAHSLRLPDGRRGEIYRLSVFHAIGTRHSARILQDYVGIESQDQFLWGGGRTEVRWSSRLGPPAGRRVALEATGSLSTGEEKLHPLSAGAPVLRLRARMQWWPDSPVELWTGVSARMVSPPSESDRAAPRSAFPSGHSFESILRWSGRRWQSELQLRLDGGGLPQSWWASWSGTVPLGAQLALRAAVHAGLGPGGSRMIDDGWTFGIRWQPSPGLSEPGALR